MSRGPRWRAAERHLFSQSVAAILLVLATLLGLDAVAYVGQGAVPAALISRLSSLALDTVPLATLIALFTVLSRYRVSGQYLALRLAGRTPVRMMGVLAMASLVVAVAVIGAHEWVHRDGFSERGAQRWVRTDNALLYVLGGTGGRVWHASDLRAHDCPASAESRQAHLCRQMREQTGVHSVPDTAPRQWRLGTLVRATDALPDASPRRRRALQELWARTLLPLACALLALVSCGLLVRYTDDKAAGGAPLLVGIGVSYGYYLAHSMAMAFGHSGAFPPWLSAGLPVVLMALLALWLFAPRSG